MVTFNYIPLKSKAETLIAKFGKDVTLRKKVASGDEWSPTFVVTDTTVKAVDLNQEIRDRTGSLVGQSVRTLFVSTSAGVTPEKEDKIIIGSELHEIDFVRELNPGGTALLWEVWLAG